MCETIFKQLLDNESLKMIILNWFVAWIPKKVPVGDKSTALDFFKKINKSTGTLIMYRKVGTFEDILYTRSSPFKFER